MRSELTAPRSCRRPRSSPPPPNHHQPAVNDSLAEKRFVPCHGGVPALSPAEVHVLAREVPTWIAHAMPTGRAPYLEKSFTFPDFAEALSFVNRIGALAETEGHHPDLHLAWGKVRIEIWTHAIGGLSESDFILAAKIDALPPG